MEKLTVKEFNAETGIESERDMTAKEIADFKEFQQRATEEAIAFRANEQAKKDAYESAKAKLVALGLTAEEAAALIR